MIIPLYRRGGLYFLEGEDTHGALSTPHTPKEKTAALVAASLQREQQFAFLGTTAGINKTVKELFNRKLASNSSLDDLERELRKGDMSPNFETISLNNPRVIERRPP